MIKYYVADLPVATVYTSYTTPPLSLLKYQVLQYKRIFRNVRHGSRTLLPLSAAANIVVDVIVHILVHNLEIFVIIVLSGGEVSVRLL